MTIRRHWNAAKSILCGFLGVISGAFLAQPAFAADSTSARQIESDSLYRSTNVWTVHLRFTADQWEALEPKGGPGPFGGLGPGPFGPPGGPGGGDGGRGGPRGFGPAMFLAPIFLSQGDLNHDGRLSREEFLRLAQEWFAAWDKNKTGKLDTAKVRAGLNATFGEPGAAGRAGPGGPGGRRPDFGLQGAEGKRNGIASAIGIEFSYVHADLEFDGRLFKDVGVRYKGNGTFLEARNSLKRPLKIELDKYVNHGRLGGAKVLNLHNCVTDASWMNEVLAYRLYRDAGIPAPRTAYARVYVSVPGKFERKYLGLYSLVENVDKIFVERNFRTKQGAILKPVTPALFADLGPDWSKYKQTYDPKTPLSGEEIKRLMQFCQLVSAGDDSQFASHLGDYLDISEAARFMAIMVWLSDTDGILGPGQNLYVYLHPKSGLFEFIPWDQDHSFGQFAMRGSQEERENLSIRQPWQGENRFLERIFKTEAFRKAYLASLEELSKTLFRPDRLTNQVNELAAVIRPAIQEEPESRLARFDKAVAGENLSGGGFGPFGGQETKPIKSFAPIRTRSVMEQLAGTSNGLRLGGFGFPGRGPGGPPRGPGGPEGFGPGTFLGDTFMKAMDANRDSAVTQEEFKHAFEKWFDAWNRDKSSSLSEEHLRAGIDKDLSPFGGGPPPGFGPPPGGHNEE